MRQQQDFGRKSPWDLQLGLWYWCWMVGGQLTVKQGYHSECPGAGWVCWWSSLSINHWTLAGSGFTFLSQWFLGEKGIPQYFFFFLRFYSAFKDNFSDHHHHICSLSKLKYAQKSNSCFYHPNIITYWGLTYVLFYCMYIFNMILK